MFIAIGRYICWWNVNPKWCHPPSCHRFGILYIFINEIYSSYFVIYIKTKILSPSGKGNLIRFCISWESFELIGFAIFWLECTWWRLFQRRVMCTKSTVLLFYLRYLCFFAYSDVQHILCCVLVCVWSSCVPYVASFSGLFIFGCPFSIFLHLCRNCKFQ